MKLTMQIIACNAVAITCAAGAITCAIKGVSGWGWFLFAAIVLAAYPKGNDSKGGGGRMSPNGQALAPTEARETQPEKH